MCDLEENQEKQGFDFQFIQTPDSQEISSFQLIEVRQQVAANLGLGVAGHIMALCGQYADAQNSSSTEMEGHEQNR